MKFLVQYLYKNQILIQILINTFILLIICHYSKQHNLANIHNNHDTQQLFINQKNKKKNQDPIINIQSNQAKFNFLNTIFYFSGNVIVSYYEKNLYADELYLYKKINNDMTTYTFLSGIGNIYYCDNIINMTGEKINVNTQNKKIDLYQGKFSIMKKKIIYGSANYIKQRENNRFTILKNTDFTFCPPQKQYWYISSSQILYDHKKENLDIWNAYFKIKKIPILYIPYIQSSLSRKENSKHLPYILKSNNLQGIEIKLPYHFNINNNFYGHVITSLIPQKGIKFQNYIQYFNNFNKSSIKFDLFNNQKLHKNYWLLHLYSNNHIQEKWHIKNSCIKINNYNNFYNKKSKYNLITNKYYIKNDISWRYTDSIWNINIFHREFKSENQQINNIYNTTPQININYHMNKFKLLNYHLFSQITHFTNTNYHYPKTIRLHIEPNINISSNFLDTNIKTEIKLKNTYYQQKNINFYNTINKKNKNNIYLKESVNRCLPEFKTNAKLTLRKKTNINQYKQIFTPQIQYLYIPYRNQNNIELYDTTILETTECTNLFKDTIYTGLDRIASANQLTSSISTKIYKKNNTELFHMSLGQIYFFTPQKIGNYIKQSNFYKNKKNNIIWGTNTYWKINQSLSIHGNLQYNTQIKKLESGNTIIEHRTNDNKMLQVNFRYLNSEYFTQITPEVHIDPIYTHNLTQINLTGNWPINPYWILSGTQFYNIKYKHTINQIIGIQYRTCCWKIYAEYERKFNTSLKHIKTKKYNNKLSIHLTLSGINQNSESQSKIYNTLHTNTVP